MAGRGRDYRRACRGKVKFSGLGPAQAAADRASQRTGGWIVAYLCQHCGGYHIGHPPGPVRQSIMDRRRNKRRQPQAPR